VRKFAEFYGREEFLAGGSASSVLSSRRIRRTRVILREVYRENESDYTKYFYRRPLPGRVRSSQGAAIRLPDEGPSGSESGGIGYLKKEDVDDSVKVVMKLLSLHPPIANNKEGDPL